MKLLCWAGPFERGARLHYNARRHEKPSQFTCKPGSPVRVGSRLTNGARVINNADNIFNSCQTLR